MHGGPPAKLLLRNRHEQVTALDTIERLDQALPARDPGVGAPGFSPEQGCECEPERASRRLRAAFTLNMEPVETFVELLEFEVET